MAPIIAQLSCLALLASTTLAAVSPLKLDFTRERRATSLTRRANGDLNLALNQNAEQNSYIIKLSIGTPPQVSTINARLKRQCANMKPIAIQVDPRYR